MQRMQPNRLASAELSGRLATEPPGVAQLVRMLRRVVLTTVPNAEEGIRFGCLCYFHGGTAYEAIGGNVCLIEVRQGKVRLSFIHGAALPDPHGLLRGSGKSKRFVLMENQKMAGDPRIADLIRAAGAVRIGGRAGIT